METIESGSMLLILVGLTLASFTACALSNRLSTTKERDGVGMRMGWDEMR